MSRLKLLVLETSTLYCFVPTFVLGSQLSRTWCPPFVQWTPVGGVIWRVKLCRDEYAPASLPIGSFGKFARTCQRTFPRPKKPVGVNAVEPTSNVFVVPSPCSTRKVYEVAPATGSQVTTGTSAPSAGLPGSREGAGITRRNLPTADQLSPMLFSSFARTRQYKSVSAG